MVDISDEMKRVRWGVEIRSGVVLRRRWTTEEKGRIVAAEVAPGAEIADVACRGPGPKLVSRFNAPPEPPRRSTSEQRSTPNWKGVGESLTIVSSGHANLTAPIRRLRNQPQVSPISALIQRASQF